MRWFQTQCSIYVPYYAASVSGSDEERKKLGSQEKTEKRRIFVNRYPNE